MGKRSIIAISSRQNCHQAQGCVGLASTLDNPRAQGDAIVSFGEMYSRVRNLCSVISHLVTLERYEIIVNSTPCAPASGFGDTDATAIPAEGMYSICGREWSLRVARVSGYDGQLARA
jgi:hypothetical protein